MKKKIILGLAAAGTAVAMLPLFAAFEAHVINVTATIENALSVPLERSELGFGTVFPQQEPEDLTFKIDLSTSFIDQVGNTNADRVAYTIRQKPKCGLPVSPATNPVTYSGDFKSVIDEDASGNFICPGNADTDTDGTGPDIDTDGPAYVPLPLLCPYLSKHENTDDGLDDSNGPLENDSDGINAFHGLPGPWTLATTFATEVSGLLDRIAGDISDTWNVDLKVPCFRDAEINNCAQDWDSFVEENGEPISDIPLVLPDPDDYVADPDLEHELFGCDLWVEVTEYSEVPD